MKKIRELLVAFYAILSWQVIFNDLSILKENNYWWKYLGAIGMALAWVFWLERRNHETGRI